MDDQYILEMSHIQKIFPGVRALSDGCIRLKKGEIHALIGENGAGKSTLMKILLGDYPADGGDIFLKGEKVAFESPAQAIAAGIYMIPQEINMVNTMDAAENIWLGREAIFAKHGFINKKLRYEKTQEIFDKTNLKIDPHTLVQELSSAHRQLLAIAKAISSNSEIIIMDEPTSSLSEAEVKQLFSVMRDLRERGVSIVFISHKIDEIFEICQRVTVLRDGAFIMERDTSDLSHDELMTSVAGRKISDMYPPKRDSFGDVIFEVKNFSAKGSYSNINFSVREKEILGIYGLVGAGRSEALRAVFGIDPHDSGEVYISGEKVNIKKPQDSIKNKVSMVMEDRLNTGIISILSVLENISLAELRNFCNRVMFIQPKKEKAAVETMVDRLSIKVSDISSPIGALSGGNQQKAIIGKWLLTSPKVLILDEPTRGIDVGSKAEIYSLISHLAEEGRAVILISSELPETMGMSDRIITFCDGSITGEFTKENMQQEKIVQAAFGLS